MSDQNTPVGGQPPVQESTPAVQSPVPSGQSSASRAPSPQDSASLAPASQSSASTAPSASQIRELRDDEDPPDGERFQISSKAFRERLDRAQRKAVRDILGTDDPKEARRLVEKYRSLEKEAEERRLAEMSERDRERERRKRTEREFEDYKRDVRDREVRMAVNEVENVVQRIAKGVVRDKALKHAIRDFQEYVSGLSDEAAEALYNDEDIQAWFNNYASEYEVGKVREPVDEKLNVGAPREQREGKPTQAAGKKMDLSTKGGLSKKEVNEYLKKLGHNIRV